MPKEKSLERLKEMKKKQRARAKIVYICLAVVLVLCATYLLLTRFFVIRSFYVTPSEYYTSQDIIDSCELTMGASLFTCNNRIVGEKIYSKHPYVSKVTVTKKMPSTIQIDIEEQDGCMYVSLLKENYALNADMKVLGKTKTIENKILIKTRGIKKCITGDLVEFKNADDQTLSKDIYKELKNLELCENVRSIDITDRFNINFYYDDRFEVYIGNEKLIDYKLKILKSSVIDFPNDKGKINIDNDGRAIIKLEYY